MRGKYSLFSFSHVESRLVPCAQKILTRSVFLMFKIPKKHERKIRKLQLIYEQSKGTETLRKVAYKVVGRLYGEAGAEGMGTRSSRLSCRSLNNQ